MSSERVIDRADLRAIESNLSNLRGEIQYVSNQVQSVGEYVENVGQEVQKAQARIDALARDFHEFVQRDQMAKNLQLAETRLVKVRQELETNFGHYGEVRRRVTGILQAVDVRLVKKETIENTTEEHMLAAPRYWLAPCLIALAAWLNDNKELAERAMMEALRRDDEKTSLFFALVTRRGSRYKASREWLDRYFALQNPHELEREIIILIDGFTNGIFGPEARTKCAKHVEAWIEELAQKVGFVEEQQRRWKEALLSKVQKLDGTAYPYLRQYSGTWSDLEQSLQGAKLHDIIHDYFHNIFNKEIVPAKSIAVAVDAMLDTLVSKFDDEELPLRREERLNSLIVEENGDRGAAQHRFDSEKTLEERVDFTQLLTNFAMHPETSYASLATQKFSIALSKEWIRQAHDDLTLDNRAAVPRDIEMSIEHWSGTTQDGTNEHELIESLTRHIHDRRDAELDEMRLGLKHWLGLIAGVLFLLMSITTPFLLVLGALGVIYFFWSRLNLAKAKLRVTEDYEKLLQSCKDILRAVLSDVVDWRQEYAREDGKAGRVTEFLDSVAAERYTFSSFDSARSIISS
ncbi:hypothetical protein N0M98_05690 [Paenibacillus doosanensis]|uniref:Uncharacterized protein n=1 Tax=Paenibacillus konkukensis TaxID=2020716 RepID=A0ABY4RTK6_9BACL|nr:MULTISPECIES: hypothetical protein [Paenibacillus]MCS7459628.1 hypothetical protein [Paenibacillus doosanensis]UQZ84712.1 hypothetical protein SK3146_03967 [Paenibacillus konkukensis]